MPTVTEGPSRRIEPILQAKTGIPWMASFAADIAPRVTVIMPLHNYGWCVERAIASVQAQTFTDWELLVIDDASEDDGPAKAEALAAHDPRIRVVRQEHRRLSGTRNNGFWLARGDYIAQLDPDDRYLPGKLAGQVEYLDNHPEVGMVYADAVTEGGRLWQNYQHETFSAEELAQRNLIPGQSVMFRRSLVQITGGNDLGLRDAEDWDQWVRFAAITQIVRLPGPNYIMGLHEQQVSHLNRNERGEAAVLADWATCRERGSALLTAKPKRIKVLHVIYDLCRHGAQRVMLNLLRHLPAEEFECSVASVMAGEMGTQLSAMGVTCYTAGGKREPSLEVMRTVGERADVVHLHYWGDDFDLPLNLTEPQKIIATNHAAGAHYMAAGRAVNCWRTELPEDAPWEYNPPDVTILNGIEGSPPQLTREQARVLLGLPADRPVYLSISRAGKIKGWDLFCDAAAAIFEREPSACCVMVGPTGGDKDYLELQARATAFRADGFDFRVMDNQPHATTLQYLRAADVLLLTSRSEALPLVVIEAQRLGVPVVASAVGGVPQLIGEGQGSLVTWQDTAGFAQEALAWTGRTTEPGAAAARYTAERMAHEYAALYRWTALQSRLRDTSIAADPLAAVNLIGPFNETTGFGRYNIAWAEVLQGSNLQLGIVPVQNSDLRGSPHLQDNLRRISGNRFDLVSYWGNDPLPMVASKALPWIVTMTEGTQFEPGRVLLANDAYRVLVPNFWNKLVAKTSGMVPPVAVVPPVLPTLPQIARHPQEPFTVLSVGELWARKNPTGLLQAFEHAFPVDEAARLHLKTWNLFEAATNDRRVVVQREQLGHAGMAELYADCEAYLHLAKAEGIGFPVLEAMRAGLPTVFPAHTGMWEIADTRLGWPLPVTGREPADTRDGHQLGEWFTPDLGAAAEALRECRDDPEAAQERAERAQAATYKYNGPETLRALRRELRRYGGANHFNDRPFPKLTVGVVGQGRTMETFSGFFKHAAGRNYEVVTGDTWQEGADASAGEFVLLVAAGVVPDGDILPDLTACFDWDIGAVTCRQHGTNEQWGVGLLRRDGYGRSTRPTKRLQNCDYADGLLLVRRDLLRHFRCPDPVSFCLSIREAGFRVVCNGEASVTAPHPAPAHVPPQGRLESNLDANAVWAESRFGLLPDLRKLSFVLLAHNRLELTRACVDSIRATTHNLPYEIVVLDNASTDGTWEWLNAQTGITALRSEQNLGVGGGRNMAAQAATGDVLFFLDNDSELYAGWQLPALLPFTRPEVGICGPVCWEMDPEAPLPHRDYRPVDGNLYPLCDVVSGNALLVRREVWEDTYRVSNSNPYKTRQNGFDPTLHRFHEDSQWCLWAKSQGATVAGTPGDWLLHHKHGTTAEFLDQLQERKDRDYRAIVEDTRPLLGAGPLWRWLP